MTESVDRQTAVLRLRGADDVLFDNSQHTA